MTVPDLISRLGSGERVRWAEVHRELRPFLPLLDELDHTPQDAEWHAEGNVAVHSALVLDAAHDLADAAGLRGADRATLLLAAALHDLGKARTTREEPDADGVPRLRSRGHARRGRDYAAYRLLDARLAPRLLLDVLNLIAEHHSLHRAADSGLSGSHPGRGVWALARQVRLPLLVLLARADARGREVRSGDQATGEDTAELLELLARELGAWGPRDPAADFRAEVAGLLPGAGPDLLALAAGRGLRDWEAGRIHTPHEAAARVQAAARQGFARLSVLCGPSGSGKTTLAHELAGEDSVVISLDALRAQLGKHAGDQSVNGQVLQAAREALRAGLRKKAHVIWDATTLRRNQRAQVLELGEAYGALTRLHVLWTPPADFSARNQGREGRVGAAVLASQLQMLEFPEVGEADELHFHTGSGLL